MLWVLMAYSAQRKLETGIRSKYSIYSKSSEPRCLLRRITVFQHKSLNAALRFRVLKYFQLSGLGMGTNDRLVLQASLSYKMKKDYANVISLPEEKAAFNITMDPTRILSGHCLNFPRADICP